jgi:hypothetical protein
MLKIKCKHCDDIIEVPLPEPAVVEKIVKERCTCGLTENTRQSRHWAIVVAIVGTAAVLSLFGGCGTSHFYEPERLRAETEKINAETAFNKKEMEALKAELERYKSFFEEWKKLPGNPEMPRPPIDPRATPHIPEKK